MDRRSASDPMKGHDRRMDFGAGMRPGILALGSLIALAASACAGSVPVSRPATASSPIAQPTVPAKGTYGSIVFTSDRVGWVASIPPDSQKTVIYRTSDAGVTWHLWGIAPSLGRPVGFRDSEVALVIGDGNGNSFLMSSEDGVTWTRSIMPGGWPVFLPDLQHGWVANDVSVPSSRKGQAGISCAALPQEKGGFLECSETNLWSTSDAGKSWQLRANASPVESGSDYFWSAASGMVVRSGSSPGGSQVPPTIETTSDGGKTWHAASILFPPGISPATVMIDTVTMFDELRGVAVEHARSSNVIYVSHTGDGGQDWSIPEQLVAPGGAQASDLTLLDENHWLIVASDNVYASSDGGAKWRKVAGAPYPSDVMNGVRVIPGHPQLVIAYAGLPGPNGGLAASMSRDWGQHWTNLGLPDVYPTYRGICGWGGWFCGI